MGSTKPAVETKTKHAVKTDFDSFFS